MNSTPDRPNPAQVDQNTFQNIASHLEQINQLISANPDLISSPQFAPIIPAINQLHQQIDDYESKNNINKEAELWVKKISQIGASRLMVKTSPSYDLSNPKIATIPDKYDGTGFRFTSVGNAQMFIGNDFIFGSHMITELSTAAQTYADSGLLQENSLVAFQSPDSKNTYIGYLSWQHPQSPGVDMRNNNGNMMSFTIALPNDDARSLLSRIKENPNVIDSILKNTFPNLFSDEFSENHLTRKKVNKLNIFHQDGATDNSDVTFKTPKYPYEAGKPRIYLKTALFNPPVGEAET